MDAHQTGHRSVAPLEVSYRRVEQRASSLLVGNQVQAWARGGPAGQGMGAQSARRVRGLGIDVLSTQSTRDPEVVKGMSESIAGRQPGG